MDVKTVPVCAEDAQFLYRLMNDPNILDSLDEVPTNLQDWIEAISMWERDPDEEDYVIFDDETPVGWLGINGLLSKDKTAYIKMIGLLPQYQSKGIGANILHQFVGALHSRGFSSVALYTNRNNVRAQNCYTKCGFRVVEELTEEMPNGKQVRRYKMERAF